MPFNDAPYPFIKPFSVSGTKNAVPLNQVASGDGYASIFDGFPPETQIPIAAGGIPPRRGDFNGILYYLSTMNAYLQGGPVFLPFSSVIANNGGYGLSALLRTDDPADGRILMSDVDGNVNNFNTDPTTIGASWKVWNGIPRYAKGINHYVGEFVIHDDNECYRCVLPNGPRFGGVFPPPNPTYWQTLKDYIGGGAPGPEPENYYGRFNSLLKLTSSGVFTAPSDGIYRLLLIGGGAGGGAGGTHVGSSFAGGRGGNAGGATSFGSFATASGGSGGGGGGTGAGGGGGGNGLIVMAYVKLSANQMTSFTIGAGGNGGSGTISGYVGTNGSGSYPGRGGNYGQPGSGGAGASTGSSVESVASGGAGGTGASTGYEYGNGGGGGGGGGNNTALGYPASGAPSGGPGASNGGNGTLTTSGNGGNGGSGVIFVEYYNQSA